MSAEQTPVIDGIPAAAEPLWAELLAAPLEPVHVLFERLATYEEALLALTSDPDVDATLANDLLKASRLLLGTLGENTPDGTRQLIQAAVMYFIIEDDAEADLDSILGLDDDAEVVNAVLSHLGHNDWLVVAP